MSKEASFEEIQDARNYLFEVRQAADTFGVATKAQTFSSCRK